MLDSPIVELARNMVYFSEYEGGRLSRVPAEGGAPTVVFDIPVAEDYRLISDLLPDGRRMLVNATRAIGND